MARKKYVFVVVLLAIALIVTGVSYAYFTAVATSNEQVVKSGTLELTYHTGKEITRVGMLPTTENNAELHQFSVENVGTLDANYYLYLNNIRLVKDGSPVISNNLKYRLYEADQNYTVQGNPIAIGSFGIESLYESGDAKLLLEENIDLPAKTTKYYVLKIWLQETGSI
jgi:sipW-cognate class signal peptide